MGASAAPSGSRASTEPQSTQGLGPTGFDPSRNLDPWGDEVSALVDWARSTVSRNPSDHETALAYRRAIASVLSHMEDGWRWEYGSFMGARVWMWRRNAIAMEAQRGATPKSDATAEGGDSAGPKDIAHEVGHE